MSQSTARALMAWSLCDAVAADERSDYDARYQHIAYAIGYATEAGVPWGFRIDPTEFEWTVVYFELPTGQISYHMPQHEKEWDGHSTVDKNARIAAFARRAGRVEVSA